jgi:hypothetical protein
VVTLSASTATASPINVAEARWEAIDLGDGETFLSLFSLTNIWDGEGDVTLFGNQLQLPDGPQSWSDLAGPLSGGINFEQLFAVGALPNLASVSISFLFGGDVITLTGLLPAADSSVVLQFDPGETPTPVPEPGTLGLVALGLLGVSRAAMRRARTSR